MASGGILMTGATGNVGSCVVRALREARHPVRIAVRNPGKVSIADDPGITTVEFDFLRPETWRPALDGVDRLFLVRPPAIADTRRHINPLIVLAREAGVRHIVFLSLLGAEKNPLLPHRRIESCLERSGIAWTFLRAGFFMQNLSTTHRQEIREEGVIAVPAGNGRTSFTDTRDIAAVAARALTESGHENHAYALTGAEALGYAEVAGILSRVLGRDIRYTNPSLPSFARHMHRQGHPWGFVAVTAAIYTSARLGLAGRVTSEVAELLGRPPITMEQFAADHAASWR